MDLMKEKQEAKFRMIIEVAVIALTLLASCALLLVSGLASLETGIRIALVVVALLVMFGGIFVAAALEMRQAVFECKHCKKRFIPTKAAYLMGMHTITKRRLRCPHCNKKSWCKRCLSLEEDEE